MPKVQDIITEINPLQLQLKEHPLYTSLKDMDDLRTFTEGHVYAVWDFMSLLKVLQNELTCNEIPWIPKENAVLARFVNEIVHGEESDLNEKGEARSHFEMYLNAMDEMGADRSNIDQFIVLLKSGTSVYDALETVSIPEGVKDFVKYTFKCTSSGKTHIVASAFTFGREDIIPDMFLKILDSADEDYPKFRYYLQRHIELDGDEHGPLSLKMIEEICGEDPQKWEEVIETAQSALKMRIKLWDAICQEVSASCLTT